MKLSVIIPNYNNCKYINKCIDSILNQSFKDFELIIVDDGSTDDSIDVINSYNDKRIIKIFQHNLNAAVARNRGLEIAKGEYIFFIDSDDELFDNNTFQKMIDDISGYDLLIGNYIKIDDKSNIIDSYSIEKDSLIEIDSNYRYCLLSPVPSNKLFKHDIIIENNLYFDNVRIGQDLNFYLKYLCVCKKIITVNYDCYKYRILNTSMSRRVNMNFIDIYNSINGIKKYYASNNKSVEYNKYISLVEMCHYSYQMNKIKKINNRKQKKAIFNFFVFCFSTINKKYCYKSKMYYSLRFKIFVKKILYRF